MSSLTLAARNNTGTDSLGKRLLSVSMPTVFFVNGSFSGIDISALSVYIIIKRNKTSVIFLMELFAKGGGDFFEQFFRTERFGKIGFSSKLGHSPVYFFRRVRIGQKDNRDGCFAFRR